MPNAFNRGKMLYRHIFPSRWCNVLSYVTQAWSSNANSFDLTSNTHHIPYILTTLRRLYHFRDDRHICLRKGKWRRSMVEKQFNTLCLIHETSGRTWISLCVNMIYIWPGLASPITSDASFVGTLKYKCWKYARMFLLFRNILSRLFSENQKCLFSDNIKVASHHTQIYSTRLLWWKSCLTPQLCLSLLWREERAGKKKNK